MSYKILVTEPMAEDGPIWLRSNGYEVKYGRGIDEATLIEDLQDCDGVIPRLAAINDNVIAHCPSLKVVARHGSGVDTVDLESCKRHGIRVVNTRGSNAVAVAEHTMMLLLGCAKNLNSLQNSYHAGKFKEARKQASGIELSGKTIAIFGFGQIGRRIASIAHDGFGMNVLAYDPYCPKDSVFSWTNFTQDKDKMFQDADFVTLHMAANTDNRHFVGAHELSLMKETAFLINTARGSLVDENALIKALQEKTIAGAGIDATETEPLPVGSPLFHMENVILTPHCAGSTKESRIRSSLGAAKGCDEVLSGKPITNLIV